MLLPSTMMSNFIVESFALWQDTAGQERFHALGPIYYRDADGLLLTSSPSASYMKLLHSMNDLNT